MNFVICGGVNPEIVKYNLSMIKKLHPYSKVYLYDWGFREKYLKEFKEINDNLKAIKWEKANLTNYMYQKVVCIIDCFEKHNSEPLIYIDDDVIVIRSLNEIWSDDWDIGATWRPEWNEAYGVPQWLNAGVLFINSINVENSLAFLKEWERRCHKWEKKAWWLDQIELIKLYSETDIGLSGGPNLIGKILIGDTSIRCKTFDWNVYNYLPEPKNPDYIKNRNKELPKIIHLKSKDRKKKFNKLSPKLRGLWLKSCKNGILLNSFVRGYYTLQCIKMSIERRKPQRDFGKMSEIYYWRNKNIEENLYDFGTNRAMEALKLFNALKKVEFKPEYSIIEIGPGPTGGVLDLVTTSSKWVIEPIIDLYKEQGIWLCKSDNVASIQTTCEEMKNVPNNYFDVVFAINSVDHGYDIGLCFKNIYNILKIGGLFFLHVHCRTEEQTNELHIQSFDEEELKKILHDSGLKILNHKIFEEDPLSKRYKTFLGIITKPEDSYNEVKS